jgi:hypothetical protein
MASNGQIDTSPRPPVFRAPPTSYAQGQSDWHSLGVHELSLDSLASDGTATQGLIDAMYQVRHTDWPLMPPEAHTSTTGHEDN